MVQILASESCLPARANTITQLPITGPVTASSPRMIDLRSLMSQGDHLGCFCFPMSTRAERDSHLRSEHLSFLRTYSR